MNDESTIDKYNKPFPTKLRKLMGDKITQKQLAGEIGVSRQAISQYMNGETTPTIDKFELLIEYFKVSADYMLGLSEVSKNNLSVKEIHEKTGLSEKAIEVLITEKYAYRGTNFLQTVNYLLEDMKPLQEFKEDTFEYYECNQDILTLIDEFINTSADLLNQTLTVSSDGISITNSESFESKYNTSISAEEIFKQVMLDRITEELKKQRVYNLLKKGKSISYEDNCKYISFIKNAL